MSKDDTYIKSRDLRAKVSRHLETPSKNHETSPDYPPVLSRDVSCPGVGRTPLSYAAAFDGYNNYYYWLPDDSLNTCKFLVDSGALVNIPDSSGRTPMSYAAASRCSDSLGICTLLVENGAEVNIPGSFGRTPLSYAAACAHSSSLCALLVDKVAEVKTDSSGRSPYWYARNANNESIRLFLAQRGGR